MVKRLIILLLLVSNITVAQTFGKEDVKKLLKDKVKNLKNKWLYRDGEKTNNIATTYM